MPVHAMRRHRERVVFRREWPALARHAELPFDFLIVRPQIIVADWPIRTHAFGGERAEIVAMESRHYAQPGQSAAAYAGARFGNHEVRADEVARLGPHDLARVGFCVLQRRVPAESRPGFQHANRQALRRHPQRHERTGRPCADDEHIKRAREVAGKGVTGHPDFITERRIEGQDLRGDRAEGGGMTGQTGSSLGVFERRRRRASEAHGKSGSRSSEDHARSVPLIHNHEIT